MVIASVEYVSCYMYCIVLGRHYYLIPIIDVEPYLTDKGNSTITVVVWEQHIDYPAGVPSPYLSLYNKSETNGIMTYPSNITSSFQFTFVDNGNYTYTFNFNETGNYTLEVTAKNDTDERSYSRVRVEMYVGNGIVTIYQGGGGSKTTVATPTFNTYNISSSCTKFVYTGMELKCSVKSKNNGNNPDVMTLRYSIYDQNMTQIRSGFDIVSFNSYEEKINEIKIPIQKDYEGIYKISFDLWKLNETLALSESSFTVISLKIDRNITLLIATIFVVPFAITLYQQGKEHGIYEWLTKPRLRKEILKKIKEKD